MTTPRRLPFLLIAAIAILCGLGLASQLIVNGINTDQRREDNAARDAQFCEAIPNVAAATAQSLVDILVDDARKDGATQAQITETKRLGVIYVARARFLARADLTTCPPPVEAR